MDMTRMELAVIRELESQLASVEHTTNVFELLNTRELIIQSILRRLEQ